MLYACSLYVHIYDHRVMSIVIYNTSNGPKSFDPLMIKKKKLTTKSNLIGTNGL
jgi:hypothetical protein